MCAPHCIATVERRLSRRGLLGSGAAAGIAALALPRLAVAAEPVSFSRVVDLTHPLGPDFPTFDGSPGIELETLVTFAEHGYNMYRWHLVEHTGTHMDAPIHFSADGPSAEAIAAEQLVVPVVVVDIRNKAAADPDAQLTPDDLVAFEALHGPVPDGACVAMNSGWAGRVHGEGFRNADADGVMHFPGVHPEAADYLMSERNAIGLAVDTLSLDHGPSADFATHYAWLPANRWGLECVASLDQLPASGATLVVGSPTIAGATGGPSRIFALV
jgi:kynurenine formamidase